MGEEKNSPQPGLSDLEIIDELVEFEVLGVPIKAHAAALSLRESIPFGSITQVLINSLPYRARFNS